MSVDLSYASLSRVATLIKSREVSPVALTQVQLERIERLNPVLNAFITVVADQAIDAARKAETEISNGRYRGKLHGIPYSLKDLVETARIRTTAGSPLLTDYIPETSATVYTRLDAAGAVLLGKSAMLEFAYGSPHPDFGLTRNPWNIDFSASGSSSGSAAAVAAGIGYGSLGSDTGGSIRMPASWCGLVGLKPTYGRVSLSGIIPLATSFDHVGPLTRTAADAAIFLSAIAGHDTRDPHSVDKPVPDYFARIDELPSRLRIGIGRPSMEGVVDEQIRAAVEQTVDVLTQLGMTIVPVTIPDPVRASRTASTMMSVEAAAYHRTNLATHANSYSYAVRTRLLRGMDVRAVDYLEAMQARTHMRQEYLDLFNQIDVLLTPTSVVTPMSLDQVRAELTLPANDPMHARIRFTSPINLIGFPALSMPAGMTTEGLPIGAQLVARPFDEVTLLAVANRFERETDWTDRHPPI